MRIKQEDPCGRPVSQLLPCGFSRYDVPTARAFSGKGTLSFGFPILASRGGTSLAPMLGRGGSHVTPRAAAVLTLWQSSGQGTGHASAEVVNTHTTADFQEPAGYSTGAEKPSVGGRTHRAWRSRPPPGHRKDACVLQKPGQLTRGAKCHFHSLTLRDALAGLTAEQRKATPGLPTHASKQIKGKSSSEQK